MLELGCKKRCEFNVPAVGKADIYMVKDETSIQHKLVNHFLYFLCLVRILRERHIQ